MLFTSTVGRIIEFMDEGAYVFSDIFMMHSTVEDTENSHNTSIQSVISCSEMLLQPLGKINKCMAAFHGSLF